MEELLPVDLRSDTVTKPTPGMRKAMADAEVGDDVFADDPTVNKLQDRVAQLLGKEAALYMPSGSMANQTSIRAQTEPGDEIICHEMSHIYHYEAGAPAGLSGCSLRLLHGPKGQFTAADVRDAMRPTNSHYPKSALILVENTSNRGSGACWSVAAIEQIKAVADEFGLHMHLDGARLMNACVATGVSPAAYAKYFDTVSTCFSKGLGAPVGSAVAGSKEMIGRVHRFRKMFGGGMRQAGIIAAGALYALDHHIDRLSEDHDNAKHLACGLADVAGLTLDVDEVETNIVYIDVSQKAGTADSICEALRQEGVLMIAVSPMRIRAVTHLDVSRQGIDHAIAAFQRVMCSLAAG